MNRRRSSNPTLTWGGGDDNECTLFNTANFVTAFDTTIHVVDGCIEIGHDFMSDSPVDVASVIGSAYSDQLMRQLDRVIAIGNGTTEPEGVMNATGTTSVAFGGVAPTIGGYEELLFGVPKQFKAGFDRGRSVFASNETSYRRARAIPVGASDERRIFGMTHEDYQLLDRPYKIQVDMANTQAFFANLARYRMYRRLGFTMRTTSEGKELTRKNLMLIMVRARYGGAMEDGSAAAVSTTLQA